MIELTHQNIDNITFIDNEKIYIDKKGRKYSDIIICIDIEVVSLFYINGKFRKFDYRKNNEFYIGTPKTAYPYILTLSINDKVYYTRDFYLLNTILNKIYNDEITHYIFIHNLSYEFHFLQNLFKKYNIKIDNILARGKRKVIAFDDVSHNIIFRCSYALTNLSLEKCAIEYKTPLKKLKGNLRYNDTFSHKCRLSKRELKYCENDVLVMYYVILNFIKTYENIKNIPLTQTGEVRKELNTKVTYYYHKKIWDLVEESEIYSLLMCAFMGGITHANFIYVDKVINKPITSHDFSSSYPFRLACYKFPSTRFCLISEKNRQLFENRDKYAMLYDVTLHNFKSKLLNHYIPFSKCVQVKNCRVDNGRVIRGDCARIVLTDVDYDIITECYDIEKIEYNTLAFSSKKYLDKSVIDFILELYERKTNLKGIDDMYFSYMKSKQKINAVFGCAVTNPLKQLYDYDYQNYVWNDNKKLDENFINEKIIEMKQSYSTLFSYATGVWVTAYARQALWEFIKNADYDTVYYDTDSVKTLNSDKYKNLVNQINNENKKRIEEVCTYYDFDITRFYPKDKNGKEHMLGFLEYEETYKQFKSLGAKKYVYRDKNNILHMTLSGVRKKSVDLLKNDINNFRDGFIFGYDINKLNLVYTDTQEEFSYTDRDGNYITISNFPYAIVAQPTTYTLSIVPEWKEILDKIYEYADYVY